MVKAGSVRFGGGDSLAHMLAAQLLALGLVGSVTLVRLWLGEWFPDTLPFALYFPVTLAAVLLGGWPAGVTALASSALIGWALFLPDEPAAGGSVVATLGLYVFCSAFMAFAGARLRTLVASLQASNAKLADSELRYRTLFETISEGFSLVRAIRGPDGRPEDYEVLEVNPAMLRYLGLSSAPLGQRLSQARPTTPDAFWDAAARALEGEPVTVESGPAREGRYYEVHFSRISDDLVAQVLHDITERKSTESHQSEMFDELNHRVKNNLALVSAMLSLQARSADLAPVRAQLQKAVDRIQAISEVHASLYRSSRKDDVDFAAYLTDLCDRLGGTLLDDERVRLTLTVQPTVLPLDKAVALGVVVNELVTNAAKYAYPAPASGEIRVELRNGDEGVTLSVADDGRGLPAEIQGSGLGMRLVRSLAQQIGATLNVGEGPGAVFQLRAPSVRAQGPALSQSRLL